MSAPKSKKVKVPARGVTVLGLSTAGSTQSPSTPGSSSTGLGGFFNTQVPSTPSLQKTSSLDSSNFNTRLSDTSTGSKKQGGFFRFLKKEHSSDDERTSENPRSGSTPFTLQSFDPLDGIGPLPTPAFIRPVPGQKLVARREPNIMLSLSRVTSSPLGTTQIGRARVRAAAMIDESIAESDWQTTTDDGEQSTFYEDASQGNHSRYSDITEPKEQHQFIVMASAPVGDAAAIAEWTTYIKFYSGVSNSAPLLDFASLMINSCGN